jgi:hypothetical protein
MPITVKDIIDELKLIIIEALIEEPRYLFRKRKILIDEEEAHRNKIIKAIIAITDSFNKDDIELVLIAA